MAENTKDSGKTLAKIFPKADMENSKRSSDIAVGMEVNYEAHAKLICEIEHDNYAEAFSKDEAEAVCKNGSEAEAKQVCNAAKDGVEAAVMKSCTEVHTKDKVEPVVPDNIDGVDRRDLTLDFETEVSPVENIPVISVGEIEVVKIVEADTGHTPTPEKRQENALTKNCNYICEFLQLLQRNEVQLSNKSRQVVKKMKRQMSSFLSSTTESDSSSESDTRENKDYQTKVRKETKMSNAATKKRKYSSESDDDRMTQSTSVNSSSSEESSGNSTSESIKLQRKRKKCVGKDRNFSKKDIVHEQFINAKPSVGESFYIFSVRLERLFKLAFPKRSVAKSNKLIEKFTKLLPKSIQKPVKTEIIRCRLGNKNTKWLTIQQIVQCQEREMTVSKYEDRDKNATNVEEMSDAKNEIREVVREKVRKPADYCAEERNDSKEYILKTEKYYYAKKYSPYSPPNNHHKFDENSHNRSAKKFCNENRENYHRNDHRNNDDNWVHEAYYDECTRPFCDYCKKVGHRIATCYVRLKACFLCGIVGHMKDYCPRNQSNVKQSYCYSCNSSDHVANECPDRLEGSDHYTRERRMNSYHSTSRNSGERERSASSYSAYHKYTRDHKHSRMESDHEKYYDNLRR